MDAAGVKAWGHRIRATFLTELVEAELRAAEAAMASAGNSKQNIDWELILLKVAERAGHRNPDALRNYVTLVRKRRDKRKGVDTCVTLEQRERYAKARLELAQRQLNGIKELESLASLLRDGKSEAAITVASELIRKIKSGAMLDLSVKLEDMDDFTMSLEDDLNKLFDRKDIV